MCSWQGLRLRFFHTFVWRFQDDADDDFVTRNFYLHQLRASLQEG